MFGNPQNQHQYGFYKDNEDHESHQDPSKSYHGSQDGDIDPNRTNLIVNYLPQYMNDKDLYSLFVTQGPLDNVRIMKDYKTGYSYGYGFVKFVNPNDAARAINALNGVEYYNKRLKVSYARPPGQDLKDSNLYVTNLPKSITEDEVEKMFSEYGVIVQKNLLKDKITGMPRGVAFVRYAKRDDAQNAILGLNGKFLEGCLEPICVKVAEDHGKQKATYYEGWKAGYQMNKGFRPQLRGSASRRGIPNIPRGGHQGQGRGHRFNPMSMGAGDMIHPVMNMF